MAPPSAAAQGTPQLKRPQETPEEKLPEQKKPKKKVKGPRAVGLLQLTSSGKGTLIPVAILIDGKFYDASVYKADPVPMALEAGTVYEAEQAGDSVGLFTISGALHSKTAGSPHPWLGAGSYLPQGTEAPKSTRKAEDVPVGLDTSGGGGGERPRLTRGNAEKPAASASPSPGSGSATPAEAGSSEKPGTAASSGSSQPASGSSAPRASGQDAPKPPVSPAPEKPADQSVKQQAPAAGQTPAQASSGQASQGQASQGQASEKNYVPTLRRGKPTQSAPSDDELATLDKLTTGKPDSPGTAGVGTAPPVKLVPAISDAGGPDPRPYKFYWKTGEEEERRGQMLALAADEVRAYANALARNRISAKPLAPAKPPAAGHKATAKPAQPVFENVQFRGYDVWATNQPVMIWSADAHFPPAPGADTPPEQYSMTLVARTDIYGNLRKLYSGVTDKFHLDVTPRLELIDAVDADGDGRAELLFRETTDAGSGYVIYRPTADKLWKMFDSLAE
jgi:hypothetical protein